MRSSTLRLILTPSRDGGWFEPIVSPSAVRIREVLPSDLPEVVALVTEVLAEFGLVFGTGSGTDEDVTRLPASYVAHGGRFWIASDCATGRLAGTCGVFPVGDGIYELRKMYLAPAARGSGAAQALFDESLAFVRHRGGTRLVLDTTHDMKRAIAFYEKNGFVRDDAQIRGARCSRGYAREV